MLERPTKKARGNAIEAVGAIAIANIAAPMASAACATSRTAASDRLATRSAPRNEPTLNTEKSNVNRAPQHTRPRRTRTPIRTRKC